MKKISLGNRDYVKASEIAKKFRYTQDYVGQLCRNEKVDARLVGRVWYVNPESVTEYRKTKHATQKNTTSQTGTRKKVPKSKVNAVIRAKTVRTLKGSSAAFRANVGATYSSDKTTNIPILTTGTSSSTKTVVNESGQKMKVSPVIMIKVSPGTKKSTQYFAKKRGEITLKSKLKVTSAADYQQTVGEDLKEEVSETAPDNSKNTQVVAPAVIDLKESKSITPEADSHKNHKKAIVPTEAVTRSEKSPRVRYFLYGVFLFTFVTAVLMILGLGSVIDVSPERSNSSMIFDLTNVLNSFLN